MNPISKVAQALGRVANHPINRRRRLKAVLEYGVIQLAARLAPGEIASNSQIKPASLSLRA